MKRKVQISWARLAAALLAAALPAVVVLLLVHFALQASLDDFYPSKWLDQADYWHEALTFKEAGFQGGYYGQGEQVAPLQFIRFGTHGPLYPILYGTLARFSGWQFSTPIYLNMVFLAAGLLVFVCMTKPQPHQIALLGALVGIFAPVLMYIPSVLQESFHQAAALILAGLFYDVLTCSTPLRWQRKTVYFLFLFILAVMRFSWGILFVPFFGLLFPWRRGAQLLALGLSAIAFSAAFVLSGLITAPGADSIMMTVEALRSSPLEGLRLIMTWLTGNLAHVFSLASWVNTGFRVQAAGLILYFAFRLWRALRGEGEEPGAQARQAAFHLLNLLPLSLALLTIYFVEMDARVLGAHVLLSLALMARFANIRPLLAVLALNLLVFPSFLGEFKTWRGSYAYDAQHLTESRQILRQYVAYQADAPSPWCNTLLVSAEYYSAQLLATPAGVGATFIWPGRSRTMEMPLKSAYLVLDDAKFERFQRMRDFHAEYLTTLPHGGKLYRNLNSLCKP